MNRRNFIKSTALVLGIGAVSKESPFAKAQPRTEPEEYPQYHPSPNALIYCNDGEFREVGDVLLDGETGVAYVLKEDGHWREIF